MRPFPLLRIPAHLLERVLPKLTEKEYFRMQQTCKDVEQFIRTNRRVNVHVRRNCPMATPRKIIIRRMSTGINPKFATVGDIYGARFKRIRLPSNILDFSAFCQYLKTHRISANELRLYARCHRGFTKENCLDLFKVMKPIKVILNSLNSDRFESLFQHKQLESVQLVVDYDRVLNVVEKLGPHLRELKIISKGSQSEIMDLVLSVIRVFERIPRPEIFKVFKFCAKWDAAPVPTLEKMFQMFRNYSPRAVEQPDAAKDKKKILCNLSDNDTFFKNPYGTFHVLILQVGRSCIRMPGQEGFPLTCLPSLLLERILPKVEEKEYFRLQRTCKTLQEEFRTNRKIQICSKRRWLLQLKDTPGGKELKWGKYFLDNLYGVRLKGLKLPLSIPAEAHTFVEDFCRLLKLHRISAVEINLHYARSHDIFTKEDCLLWFDVLKPSKVSLRSYGSDKYGALLQLKDLTSIKLFLDRGDVMKAVEEFFPRVPTVKLCCEDQQTPILDLATYIVKAIDNIQSMPENYTFKFIGRWNTFLDPPVWDVYNNLRLFVSVEKPFFAPRRTRIQCHLSHHHQSSSQDNETRSRADQKLQEFYESPDCVDKCIVMLTEGQGNQLPYTQLVASQTLHRLISSKNRQIAIQKKLDLSVLLFNFLPSAFSTLAPYVLSSLCSLFARITKQEWSHSAMDKEKDTLVWPFREPIFAIIKSIKIENMTESRLATQMLTSLVSDMSTDAGVESISTHRRGAAQFRDEPLLQIFRLCIDFLNNNVVKARNIIPDEQMLLVGNILDLTLAVLTYDFIGISNAEDPGEENTNIQVPASWKVAFADGMPMSLLYPLYEKLPQRYTERVLHVGVQLASIRRSFFTSQDRASYLNPLVEAVKGIAEQPQKLEDPGSFHQFARLVVRVKTNYQLFELLTFKDYPGLLSSIAQLTIQSIWMIDVSANSVYFLLMFWARMVGSVPYHRTTEDHLIQNYIPQIYKAYVESRLRLADRVVMEDMEDPFLDQASIIQTMEMMATISRFDLAAAHSLLLSHFDTNIQIIQNEHPLEMRHKCASQRIVWVVTLMGTLIYGKRLVSQPDEMDKLDGQMLARCINYMRVSDQSLAAPPPGQTDPVNGRESLELAFLFALESYRKAYIYTQTKATSSVYENLSADAGIPDELEIIAFFSQKILNNLRFWALNNTVLVNTLDLFREISQGYTAARKLVRLPEMQMLFQSHTAENFAFLRSDVSYAAMKNRTEFYEAITRVFLVDLNEDEEAFRKYVKPMEEALLHIIGVMEGKVAISSVEELQRIIIGALRDIRGVAKACATKSTYQILFDWLYPRIFQIMGRSMEEWPENPEIVMTVLRLMEDLSQNQQERLKFDLNSCSAVLLFKEMAKIIISYGEKFLQLPAVSSSDKYRRRYKIVGSIYTTIKNTLVGGYVPFGVFRLYGDTCLNDLLITFTKICSTIEVHEIQNYLKLSQSYYGLLEMIARTNMPFLSRVPPETFVHVLKSLAYGIFNINHNVVTTSCSALDDILTYLYKRVTKPPAQYVSAGADPEGDECITAVQGHPEILSDMLASMLSALIYSDMKCQWSLSRPMLGLILLQEYVYSQLKSQLIQNMPVEHHQSLNLMFENLMSGVEMNLTVKNKDNFTQNVSRFRQELCSVMKTGTALGIDIPNSASDNTMSG